MNTDTTILNKTLANQSGGGKWRQLYLNNNKKERKQIEHYIRKIIHHDQVRFIQGVQDGSLYAY